MVEDTAFKYILALPAALGLVAVWIVLGSIGAKIAARHAAHRSSQTCPRCQTRLQGVRQGLHNRLLATLFLVDITRYGCRQCGFRHSVWID